MFLVARFAIAQSICTAQGCSAAANPEQAKELLRLLVKDIRVHDQHTIIPTYRIPHAVRTMHGTVGLVGAYSNADTQERLRRLASRLDRLAASDAPRRPSARHDLRLRTGLVPHAIMGALGASVEPMRVRDIHAEVEELLGQHVSPSAIKNWLGRNLRGEHPVVVRLGRGRYRLIVSNGRLTAPSDRPEQSSS